jgi:hypothetical protein
MQEYLKEEGENVNTVIIPASLNIPSSKVLAIPLILGLL